ncbi:MAG: hypothetical protein ACK56N_08290, partial [Betaproteobacteria bacterium]
SGRRQARGRRQVSTGYRTAHPVQPPPIARIVLKARIVSDPAHPRPGGCPPALGAAAGGW